MFLYIPKVSLISIVFSSHNCCICILMLPIPSQSTLFLPPENIRKPYSFLMFSWCWERVHWKRMGLLNSVHGQISNKHRILSFELRHLLERAPHKMAVLILILVWKGAGLNGGWRLFKVRCLLEEIQ